MTGVSKGEGSFSFHSRSCSGSLFVETIKAKIKIQCHKAASGADGYYFSLS